VRDGAESFDSRKYGIEARRATFSGVVAEKSRFVAATGGGSSSAEDGRQASSGRQENCSKDSAKDHEDVDVGSGE
jgi:hypothetical protein